MRRVLSAFLILTLFLCTILPMSASAGPEDYDSASPQLLTQDELYAQSVVLIDRTSGDILFAKDENRRMAPASTTKIMTLLLGLESGIDLDSIVAIPQAASDVPSDSTLIPVYPGDQLSFRDLLTSFFICSGNDGANAIAILVSGTIEGFVVQMNRRAQEIGCLDTHFSNAHGYTAEDHYTTAYDLALITQAAMKNETFRSIAAMTTAQINIVNRGLLRVTNKHYIMRTDSEFYYSDCVGVKTGSTNAAGKCYVGAATRNGANVISVVLKCEEENERWIDTIRLFNYAWTQYDAYTLPQMYAAAESDVAKVTISNVDSDDPFDGVLDLLIAQVSNSSYLRMIERNSDTALSNAKNEFINCSSIEITHELTAPITKGEIMGNFAYNDPETGEVVTAVLVASRDVAERPPYAVITDIFPFLKVFGNKLFPVLIGFIVLLVILILMLRASRRRAKERRRRKILEQRRREYLRRKRAGQLNSQKRTENVTRTVSSSGSVGRTKNTSEGDGSVRRTRSSARTGSAGRTGSAVRRSGPKDGIRR